MTAGTIAEDLVPVFEHVERLVRLGYPIDEALDFRLAGRDDRALLEPAANAYIVEASATAGRDEQRVMELALWTVRRHAGLV